MNETTTDLESTERSAPAPDPFAVVTSLLALVTDPTAIKARLDELHRAEKGAADRLAKAEAAGAELEQSIAAQRSELEKLSTTVHERRAALEQRENSIAAREDAIKERESAVHAIEQFWRFLGEDDQVRSGFREPELNPYQKARAYADGVAAIAADPHYEQTQARDVELSREGVDGVEFPKGVTLTRDINVRPPTQPRSAAGRKSMRRAGEVRP